MKLKHLLIEGYCNGEKGQKDDACENTLKMGVHCLRCPHFSYCKCPDEIALTNSEGVVEYPDDFIGFGGDMEPADYEKRAEHIAVWKRICREKINEAYDEYMRRVSFNKNPPAELYLVGFKIHQANDYTFWYTDELDGFLLDDDHKIKFFSSQTEARLFAEGAGFKLNEEVLSLSTDILSLSDADSIDCDLVLTYWNLFSDAAHSVNCRFLGDSREDDIQSIYNKLFYGCNLPAVKNDGETFSPAWDEAERRRILEVLENGFEMISKALH